MKKVFTALLLLTLTAAVGYARPAQGGARLIDSYGNLLISDILARLDRYAIEIQNEPAARASIVFYAAKHKFPGWPMRKGRFALEYLRDSRGIDAARLELVNGGLRDDMAFELWVVPHGAELPVEPFDVSLLMAGEKTALPFDRFTVIERGDPVEVELYDIEPGANSAELYEYFVEVLRRDPGLRGCVIGYTSRRGARAAGRRIASLSKRTLARSYAVDVGRIAAFGGGRREYKMIELWLVPPGAELPKPTPDAAPARRKRR